VNRRSYLSDKQFVHYVWKATYPSMNGPAPSAYLYHRCEQRWQQLLPEQEATPGTRIHGPPGGTQPEGCPCCFHRQVNILTEEKYCQHA
jgi:hypothetical protein